MAAPHRLLFLDPGHFHAALTLRAPHPRVADEIVVYAPEGAERRDFLALVARFNERGTGWRVDVAGGGDPLARLVDERRGDVVVLAGRNAGKARTIARLHAAGFHVLADKPWLVEPEDLADVQASLAGWPLAAEIMTGRHDVAARLLKRLVDAPDVFGAFRAAPPAIEMDSVHHLEKLVDGAPLRRPWWFFDVGVQGRGVVDIPTHLVDRAQWLTESVAPADSVRLVRADASTTRVPLASLLRITGEREVPPELRPFLDGDALDYACNAALELGIGALTVRASARWDLAAPPGGGDTSRLVAHGTRSDVRLEQSARTAHRRQLVVEPHGPEVGAALVGRIVEWQGEFPGVRLETRAGDGAEVVVPAALDGGHEAHFALVLDDFLTAIDAGRWPAALAARTAAKYALLAEAAAATRLSGSRARSPR